jgi:protein SCO1/2
MFYASCPYACPTLISDIQRLEQRLGKDTRLDVRVLLVSLDPERDTPSALLALASKRGIDTTRWSLTVTDEASVRTLAAALGVKYRKLESGEFNHTSVISVLGRDGSILSQSEGLNASNDELLRTLAEMSKPPT